MISERGPAYRKYCGVNYYAGGIFMALLVFCAFAFGLEETIDLVGMMGSLIIGVALFVAICTILPEAGNLSGDICPGGNADGNSPCAGPGGWAVSFTPRTTWSVPLAFLMALGRDARRRRGSSRRRHCWRILLMLTAVFMNMALLANLMKIEAALCLR